MDMPKDNEIQEMFLTQEQEVKRYDEFGESIEAGTYFFTIEKEEQRLIYLAAIHSHDSKDPWFESCRVIRKEFLEKSGPRPKKIIVEGATQKELPDEKEAISLGAEVGLMIFLSRKEGIPYECPEPNKADRITYLQQFFDDDQIFYFLMARHVFFRLNIPETHRPPLQEYLKKHVTDSFDILDVRRTVHDFSREHFVALHNDYFHEEPKVDNRSFWNDLGNPHKNLFFTNEIQRKSGDLRELVITKQILQAWNAGYDLFVVYGASHAIQQRAALEKFCR